MMLNSIPSLGAEQAVAHDPPEAGLDVAGDGAAVPWRWVQIADLRPTQMAVGFREVAHKRRRYREAEARQQQELIRRRPAPLVLGPGGQPFLLDRHHWLCALREEAVQATPAAVQADLSHLDPAAFWESLMARGWCRPIDADGRRQAFTAMPGSLAKLQDDPFRSLASAVQRRGGVPKLAAPFSEFAWADALRERLERQELERDFEAAIERALRLCAPPGPRAPRPAWSEERGGRALEQPRDDQG